MQNRLRIGLIAGVFLALGVLGIYLWGTPRLLSVSPEDRAERVPSSAVIRIVFSRPLQTDELKTRLTLVPEIGGSFRWEESTLIFTPELPWPAGVTVQARLESGAPASGFPPLALRGGAEWSFKIRQQGIVYLYPANGPANMYLLNPVSAESTALTDVATGVLDFTISQDGKSLYYSIRKQSEGSAIYRLDLVDTGEDTLLERTMTPTRTLESSMVLDCMKAICQGLALDLKDSTWHMNKAGSRETAVRCFRRFGFWGFQGRIPPPPFQAGDPVHQTILPAWSKNGLLAYYDSNEMAYFFIEPKGVTLGKFPNQTGQQGAWRPDGQAFLAAEIFYLNANISPALSNLESLADSRLILYDLIAGKTEDITPGMGVEDAVPAYSPDGNYLAFARKYLDVQRWTPGRQLWIARVAGREARPLTDSPLYNHFDFAWSFGGDQLAYVRFNQSVLYEPPEIWVLDLLSSEAVRYVQDGYKPQWIP